jgi:hypothetical protein
MSGATNWSQRGKAALQEVSAIPEGYQRIGGANSNGTEIVTFYRLTEPKEGMGDAKTGVLKAGDKVEGTYAGNFTNKKFGNLVHKVVTAKGLVALPNATQLNNALKGIAEGTKLLIQYNGKNVIKTGKYAGKAAHSFDVFAA